MVKVYVWNYAKAGQGTDHSLKLGITMVNLVPTLSSDSIFMVPFNFSIASFTM